MKQFSTVTFLEINSSYSHSLLSYAILRARGEQLRPQWQWRHVIGTNKNSAGALAKELMATEPDLILASGYIFNQDRLLEVLQLFHHHHPEIPIVLGGPNYLGDNRQFLEKHPEIKLVVRGEENSLETILDKNWEAVPGGCTMIHQAGEVRYIDNGLARINAKVLDEFVPSPYREEYLPHDKVFYQLETARGCESNCCFCTSARTVSGGVRFFSYERVRSDLQALYRHGFREIRVLDRTFNQPPERCITLLQLFREEFPEVRFHLEIDPGRMTPEVVAEFHHANPGQLHLECGIQTFNPDALHRLKRAAASRQMYEGICQLIDCKLFEVHTDLIAGLPGVTREMLLQDIRKLLTINPNEIQLELLKILPGTPLALALPPEFIVEPNPPFTVLASDVMSCTELLEAAHWSRVLDGYFNHPRLHAVFQHATQCDEMFLESFFCFTRSAYDACQTGQLPLEKRFELMEKFGISNNWLQFAALMANVPLKSLPLLEKIPEDYERLPLLWHKDGVCSRSVRRCCRLYLSEKVMEPFSGSGWYLFGMYYGRMVGEIRFFKK